MRKTFVFAGLVCALMASALPQAPFAAEGPGKKDQAPVDISGPPDATADFEASQFRLIFGGASGKGTLHYKGKDYNFTLKGATVGGVGYTDVQGHATVHNLKKIGDFAGTYSGIGIGAALVKGAGNSSFQNGKGVVVTTKGKADGVALNLGLSGIEVKLSK